MLGKEHFPEGKWVLLLWQTPLGSVPCARHLCQLGSASIQPPWTAFPMLLENGDGPREGKAAGPCLHHILHMPEPFLGLRRARLRLDLAVPALAHWYAVS